jgi:CheY-like chemotaxis protein
MQPNNDNGPAKPLAGRKILVAEDGPDNQHLISLRLRQAGAAVELAGNGRIALEIAQAAEASGQAFDLIFMDMQMPEMDGYTATSRLRAAGYRRPIVALTAHAMGGDREKCLQAGCDEYLSKPIDNQRMIQTAVNQIARFAAASSSPAAVATAPTEDSSPLVSELASDPDMHEAIDRYVARLQSTADGLASLIGRDAPQELQRTVHQMKGSAGGYGFPDITTAAARLEQSLKAGAPQAERDTLLSRLIGLCRRAQPCTRRAAAAQQEAAR